MLCLHATASHDVMASSHLQQEEMEALRTAYTALAAAPLASLEEQYFSRRGMRMLGAEPPCDCTALGARGQGSPGNASAGTAAPDTYYRHAMIQDCDCMMASMMASIRQRFSEETTNSNDNDPNAPAPAPAEAPVKPPDEEVAMELYLADHASCIMNCIYCNELIIYLHLYNTYTIPTYLSIYIYIYLSCVCRTPCRGCVAGCSQRNPRATPCSP
jgi:hypothetical protein